MYKDIMEIQKELKVPKSKRNEFGKYNYRNCEDIVEALKPLLYKRKLVLILEDELVEIGDRYYIKATATIIQSEGDKRIAVSAYARENDNQKGMDAMQLTGATSSYARKYALNGLFGIDDTKDSDVTNTHGKDKPTKTPTKTPSKTTVQMIKTINMDEIVVIKDLLSEMDMDKQVFLKSLKKHINVSELEDIPQVHYARVVNLLEKKREAANDE